MLSFRLSSVLSFLLAALVAASVSAVRAADTAAPFELRAGDRVVFLGDTVVEREQQQGWIELMLTARFPDRAVTFRNLGWSADTPAGDSRFGLSLLQAGREPADEGWQNLVKQLEETKPTVAFLGYGMASSFDGEAGLAKFKADYGRLLDTLNRVAPGVRLVLLTPLPHESTAAHGPAPLARNAEIAAYARAVSELAAGRGAKVVPLFDLVKARPYAAAPITANGIHPTPAGYRVLAETLEDSLFGAGKPGPWRTSTQTEALRRAIVQKNEWYFHRSRPANMAYIFGFRKREQGKNAAEVLQFDEAIAREETRIAQLRGLQLVNVPEIPRRIGNVAAKFTPQPHPQFEVADGFEVTLWAENPLLNKPLQMNFDARGRLWVVSSELYPQIEPGQAATDKIIVLEDTTGAGRADKATVFADGLLIPTGIEVGDGGAYVAQSTELLHFKDTDGDGKSDVRTTVLSGFGTEDTHHNLHTLRWGPDGRLNFNQSVYTRTDTETPKGVVRLKAGGIFRFDPRVQRMEILFRGLVNGWGHQFDDYGQSFMTDGAGFQGIAWGVVGATYRTLAPARRQLESVSPGAYPKFCGLEIVRSSLFPADWQGDMVTADFRAHRIVRFKITEQGSGYVTKEMPDVIRTTTSTFRPIDLRMGPDGALYIADWSNPIIQHGEVDFRDPRRDKAHGRIWRIAPAGKKAAPRTDLAARTTAELLQGVLSPEGYVAEQSRRILNERGWAAVQPDLDRWFAALPRTDERARLNALWLYQAFDNMPARLVAELLAAQDARVRAAAVRALAPAEAPAALERLVADPHPRVRLEAVRALGRLGTARAAELALGVLERPMDVYLDYAVWLTLNELTDPWIAAVKSGAWKTEGREKQLEFALKAVEPARASEVLGQLLAARGLARDGSGPWIELIGAAGGPPELRLLLDTALKGGLTEPAVGRAFEALAAAARLRATRPSGDLAGIAPWLRSAETKIQLAALGLAGAWKLGAVRPALLEIAGGAETSAAARTAAFAALRDLGGAPTIAALKKMAREATLPAARREAVVVLAALELPTAAPEIVAVLQATTDEASAQALWRALLSVRGVGARLAADLPAAGLPKEVARAGLRPAREGTQHQTLVPVLVKLAGLTLSDTQLSPAELQQLARDALAQGDAARGERIYRRAELACVACHAIGGAGGKLGPDLTSIGASAPADYLVESLLYPNAKIKEGYHSVMIATKDGRELNGMVVRETGTEVLLRDAANQEISISAASIARRASVGSLMPAGLIDGLVPEERADLFKFLSQLGKPGDYDAGKGGVARGWKLYLVVSANQHLGVERVIQGDPTLESWVPVVSLVNGSVSRDLIEAAYPNRGNSRGLFAATQFEAAKAGDAAFRLTGEAVAAWVNGEKVRPGPEFAAKVRAGTNTIVLQLSAEPLPAAVRLGGDVAFALP